MNGWVKGKSGLGIWVGDTEERGGRDQIAGRFGSVSGEGRVAGKEDRNRKIWVGVDGSE